MTRTTLGFISPGFTHVTGLQRIRAADRQHPTMTTHAGLTRSVHHAAEALRDFARVALEAVVFHGRIDTDRNQRRFTRLGVGWVDEHRFTEKISNQITLQSEN